MSDWSEALHSHSVTASNRYNDSGLAYDLSQASKHVLYLEQRIEELERECRSYRNFLEAGGFNLAFVDRAMKA